MKITITISIDTKRISSEEKLCTTKLEETAAILENIAKKLRKGKVPDNDKLFDCECKAVGSLRVTKRTKQEAEEYKNSLDF